MRCSRSWPEAVWERGSEGARERGSQAYSGACGIVSTRAPSLPRSFAPVFSFSSSLRACGRTVINAGVSGDTSSGALRRVDWVLKAKPTLLLIAIGANDGLRGQPLDRFEANLRGIIAKAKTAQAIPLLAGMQMPTNLGVEYRTAFESVYTRVAQDTGTALLPFLLVGVAMQPALNQTDGIHPNAAGHEVVAKTVLAFVEPHLR